MQIRNQLKDRNMPRFTAQISRKLQLCVTATTTASTLINNNCHRMQTKKLEEQRLVKKLETKQLNTQSTTH